MKTTNFYSRNGFCSHFHNFNPFGLFTFFKSKWISFFCRNFCWFTLAREKYFFKAFVDVGQIGGKNLVYIVELHVKLRPKQIKIVEMRAKSVSWVKICRFSMNFHYFSSFAQFTLCNCLNCQNQYCSIICIFSKCSGISKMLPPVWAPRVHQVP